MLDVLKQIADACLNKYIGFYCGVFIFFMPVFYRIKLYFESRRNFRFCKEALLQLCNSEPNWIEDKIPELSLINDSKKPFSLVNIVSQALFSINLFQNNEPTLESGFKECKLIPMYTLNHFLNLYNHSLFSGFWSLVLKPHKLLLDEFKMIVYKDEKDETKRMIIIIKFDKDNIKIFKFINFRTDKILHSKEP